MDATPPSVPARLRRPVAASLTPPVASLGAALLPALLLVAVPTTTTGSGTACVGEPGGGALLEPKRVELTPTSRAPDARGSRPVR